MSKPLTQKQKGLVSGIEEYLGLDLSGMASYVKQNVVALDISSLKQHQIHAIENYGRQFDYFKVEPNGYKKIALIMPKQNKALKPHHRALR